MHKKRIAYPQRRSRQAIRPALVGLLALILLLVPLLGLALLPVPVAHAAGQLDVSIIAGYNLVVDSNVSSPSTYAPRVATVIGKFCNTGDAPLTNVYGYIGNGTTPGTYPVYDSDTQTTYPYLNGTGDYFFRHLGAAGDASRSMGTIPAGQCRYQYWSFEYPACENVGGAWQEPPCAAGTDPLWGPSIKPEDDFALQFVIWGNSEQGGDSATWTMTMRNEISAVANKIKPNPDGRWFNTQADTVEVGDVITTNGILYTLGNINQGFDNDGDFVPDYNAWVQPLSQADFDPTCFRLIRTSGVLTVTRAGNPTMIVPFSENLYFTNLPPDNTGVRGEVYYTFLALRGPCSMGLTPYQEVASGYDNEKFNGDYGTGVPFISSLAPEVTIDKSSDPAFVARGGTITYDIYFANTGDRPAGLTLSSGYGVEMPLMVSDAVPDGLQLAAAATYHLNFTPNSGATIRYSTDSGATWSTTAPVGQTSTWPNNKIIIQWGLNDPLPDGSTGNYARFQATVPSNYGGVPVIENTACTGLGDADPFACDTTTTIVQGTGSIGDFVWRDENNDTQQTGETTYGIDGVAVSLYWDRNGDGQLDDGDLLLSTQDTRTSTNPGYYQFTQLPAGNFLVVVDKTDAQIPTGYRLTTPDFYAIALASGQSYQTADFGFGPSLSMKKRLLSTGVSGCDAYEGREVVYAISLTNERPGTGETVPGGCRYPIWSTTGSTANPPKSFTNYAYAFGAPDNLYASGDFAIGSNRWIKGTGFDPGSAGGTITQVEAVYRVYLDTALTNDYVEGILYQGATALANNNFTTAQLNQFVGVQNAGYLAWTIPGASAPGGSWTWDDFANLTLHLEPEKNGGADSSILYMDAIGFRVTTSGACPATDPNDIMVTVPLTDTYDTTYLQFVSADPPQTSVDAVNGLISWNNVGPIYPGQTRIVYVRFLAKSIGGTGSATVNNVARSTGTRFADGGYANDVHDTASGTICQTGSINGYVYSDPNSSGWNYSPGAGDLPIPGVRVTLYGCYNTTTGDLITNPGNNQSCAQAGGEWRVRATTVTDANGYYEFNGLLNGYYYVQVTSADIPGTVQQTAEANDNQAATGTLPDTTASGHTCGQQGGTCDSTWGTPTGSLKSQNDPQPFNAINSPGETINGVNFGYNIQAGAYGSVWEDNNGDGDKDGGEGPIGSVTVWLYNNSDCSGTPIATTTTDANGRYQFGNLTAGATYCIAVNTSTLPGGSSGWTQTGESDGSINNRITFTAVAGALSGSHDFGFRKTGNYALGDTLYYDWDGDGAQDSNEEGIPNVTVSLYEDANGNGSIDPEDALISTTVTSGSGYYQFANLAAGSYVVIVDTNDSDFPTGVVETQDPDESGVCTICNSRGRRTITNASFDDVDFGYRPRGSGAIGDTVYRDMNGDGTQAGPTETGIPNITVWLEVDLNNDGTYARVASAVTDADGKYLFENLPDAKYRVVVDTSNPDLPQDYFGHTYVPSTPTSIAPITISGGNTYLDADFGFKPLSAIGDRVWRDDNGNGNQDIGEPGISGVTVGLYTWTDTNNNGYYDSGDALTWLANDVTDADGLYLFSGLASGNYVVQVDTSTLPAGFTQTGDPDWTTVCQGTQCDSASGATLRAGQIDLSRDFGYRPQGVIGDYIWFDSDGDGVQDEGEQGIPYVTVRLCSDADCNNVLATTQTDSDGYYAFGNLSGGTYYVQVVSSTLPAGLNPTYDLDGTSTPHVTAVTLPQGGSNLDADFGYRYAGDYDISGTVFFDVNDNGGLYESGTDSPYEGITVYLWKDGAIIGVTTTNASGYYIFPDLPNGDYIVSVDRNSPQLAGLTQNTPAPNPPYYRPVTINNASVPDQDFGYYAAIDYGDLPDTYRTLLASEGAGHIIGGPRLGSTITAEPNGQPTAAADGDSDDGVTLGARQTWTAGSTVDLNVSVTGSNGYLVGWFDWNGDGSFGAGEMVIFGSLAAGSNALTVSVPSTPPGTYIYTRFRLYDSATMTFISASGLARGGEVEDYRWPIGPTAVKLLSFTAAPQLGHIVVAWETATEHNNVGFHLYRRKAGTQDYARLNATLIPSWVPGGDQGASYTFRDQDVQAGVTYEYMLEDVDINGTRSAHGPTAATAPYTFFFPLIAR